MEEDVRTGQDTTRPDAVCGEGVQSGSADVLTGKPSGGGDSTTRKRDRSVLGRMKNVEDKNPWKMFCYQPPLVVVSCQRHLEPSIPAYTASQPASCTAHAK